MGHSILVVEDDEDISLLLVNRLAKEGYVLKRSGSAEDALRRLKAEPADLVLIDLMLPDENGSELARRILQDPTLPRPKIVFLSGLVASSGRDVHEVTVEGESFPALGKPVDPEVLLATIRQALQC